jgi:hypothetical protein
MIEINTSELADLLHWLELHRGNLLVCVQVLRTLDPDDKSEVLSGLRSAVYAMASSAWGVAARLKSLAAEQGAPLPEFVPGSQKFS